MRLHLAHTPTSKSHPEPMMMPDPVFPRLLFSGIPWGQMEKERWKEDWSGKWRCGNLWQGCPFSYEVWFTETKLLKGSDGVPSVNTQNSSRTCKRGQLSPLPQVSHNAENINSSSPQRQTDIFNAKPAIMTMSLWDQVIRLLVNLLVNYLGWPCPSGP